MNNFLRVLLGVALLVTTSQLNIPIQPIPITLQTVGVMLIALFYSTSNAIAVISFYLLLGMLGVPVYAGFTSGISKLFGPSGGYLWGFLVAAIVMCILKRYLKNTKLAHILLNCLMGTIVILACGVIWLKFFVGFASAIKTGLYPFIIPGLIKVLIAGMSFYAFNILFKRMR